MDRNDKYNKLRSKNNSCLLNKEKVKDKPKISIKNEKIQTKIIQNSTEK